MAIKKRRIIRGCKLWWKTDQPASIWIELGKRRARTFVFGNQIAKGFLLFIPAPWGPIAFGLASHDLNKCQKNLGPNGLWVKLSYDGLSDARKRNRKNKGRAPSPW